MSTAMTGGAARIDRVRALAALLRHDDPSQLYFQLAEIAGDRIHLRHGVEVREGDVVLDVGANVGVAAAYFASQCRAKLVHCFEPVAPICDLLRENLETLPACVVHEQGLSSAPGRASITYYPKSAAMSGLYADPERDRALALTALINLGFSADEADKRLEGRYAAQKLSCELRTLSSFLRDEAIKRVDLLKIDVERAELDVLGGIEDADWPKIEQVVVEVHDEDGRCTAIASALQRRGFRVATGQEPVMRGTSLHMLYATRR
jgi:31-O-methyltransferase